MRIAPAFFFFRAAMAAISPDSPPTGAGLGFRLPLADELLRSSTSHARFLELAPENFLDTGGRRARLLHEARERWPLLCHGLCGDLSGAAPIDMNWLTSLRAFLRQLNAPWYSDHLCLTHAGDVALHDLIPLPFHHAAVERCARRIRELREVLEVEIAVENISAYARMPGSTLNESAFLCAVLEEADCKLLLDVNNVYVNATNFAFDAHAFIDSLPLERVVEVHIAGHEVEGAGLLVDTHGADVIDPVFALLSYTLRRLGRPVPVLLERDHHIPPLGSLEHELHRVACIHEDAQATLGDTLPRQVAAP